MDSTRIFNRQTADCKFGITSVCIGCPTQRPTALSISLVLRDALRVHPHHEVQHITIVRLPVNTTEPSHDLRHGVAYQTFMKEIHAVQSAHVRPVTL